MRRAGFVVIAILAIALDACSPTQSARTEAAAQTSQLKTEVASSSAAPPSDVQPAAAPSADPLSIEAANAQAQLLQSQSRVAQTATSNQDARDLLNNRVLGAFEKAVFELKAAGVKFQPAQNALNHLNVDRRGLGVFELNTKFQDPTDTLRIVGDDLTGDPFALVYLEGTKAPQAFGPEIPRTVIGADGHLVEDCKIGITPRPNYVDVDYYSCRDLTDGKLDNRLVSIAKKYLMLAMKMN